MALTPQDLESRDHLTELEEGIDNVLRRKYKKNKSSQSIEFNIRDVNAAFELKPPTDEEITEIITRFKGWKNVELIKETYRKNKELLFLRFTTT